MVRIGHILTNKDWQENIALDFKGAVIPALQAIIKGKPNMAKLEHAHTLERRELGNMQKLATNEEVKAIKSEIIQKRKEATKSYKVDVGILRASIERSIDNQESKSQGENKKSTSTRKAFSDRVKQATSTDAFRTATKAAKEQAQKEQEQTRDNSGRSKF